MAIEQISLDKFLELRRTCLVLDVRSPGEYEHAHIPGAINLPLFSDEERKIVGTAYKKESREKAIKIGLGFFGTKMAAFVEMVEQISDTPNANPEDRKKKTVLLHCWRGGMRSAGMAWLLDLYGFKVFTLLGGYKVFRRWALECFEKPYPFQVIGGYTGSGKTEILQQLKTKGEVIIDLEAIACHKGSAFGNLEEIKQPSQEFFENKLAVALSDAAEKNREIWIEDESRRIGDINLPLSLFSFMESMPVFFINIPFEERLGYLVKNYGRFEKERLINAILRIKKRLGPPETKKAIDFLLLDETGNCFEILLKYYDKLYRKSALMTKDKRPRIMHKIPCENINALVNASQIMRIAQKNPVHES